MTLNVANLDRLISYLEALPPEEFNMKYPFQMKKSCGTVLCIAGHIELMTSDETPADEFLGFNIPGELWMPEGWNEEEEEVFARYPLPRAIRTLKHLRSEFLRTGTVVVDWDAPETVEAPRKPWAPPLVIGADKELPSSLTKFVREPATSAEV